MYCIAGKFYWCKFSWICHPGFQRKFCGSKFHASARLQNVANAHKPKFTDIAGPCWSVRNREVSFIWDSSRNVRILFNCHMPRAQKLNMLECSLSAERSWNVEEWTEAASRTAKFQLFYTSRSRLSTFRGKSILILSVGAWHQYPWFRVGRFPLYGGHYVTILYVYIQCSPERNEGILAQYPFPVDFSLMC